MKKYKMQIVLGLSLLLILIVLGGVVAMFFRPTGEVNLSAAKIPGQAIGKEWSGPSGVFVNDFQASPGGSEEEKKIISIFRTELSPAGVSGVADFIYWQKSKPLAQISVKIYVFQTPELCEKWIQDHYHAAGWQANYRKVGKPGCSCFDSLSGKMRIAATGRVLIMSGSQVDIDIHLKVLDLYLRKFW